MQAIPVRVNFLTNELESNRVSPKSDHEHERGRGGREGKGKN